MLVAPASCPVYPVIAERCEARLAATHSSTPGQLDLVLNQQELWKHLDGDIALLRELTDLFVHNYPIYLQAIRQAIRQRQGAALVESALTMKGMVGNLGATEALQVATRLEELGQQGEFYQAAEAYLILDHTLMRLVKALSRLCRPADGREDRHP